MSRVGIYGGTFDPVHNGHLITAQSVLEKRDLDKIIFIPARINPLKRDAAPTTAQHRLEMLKLAISAIPEFDYSSYEINNNEVSYTINTLNELNKIYDNLELIIGYDNFVVFDKWKNYNEILEKVTVVVMKRTSDNKRALHNLIEKFEFVDTPMIDISASDIRRRIKEGRAIDFFVPDVVKNYILKNGIYV